MSELKRLWEPAAQGKIKRWSQVHEGWADQEIHLFGAGPDSGTYDYFTKAIVGVEHSSRTDYTPSGRESERPDGWQMTDPGIVVVGGSDAGISAGLGIKELAPEVRVHLVVADEFPNFSICGLPFYHSGEVKDWHALAHRTVAQIEASGSS